MPQNGQVNCGDCQQVVEVSKSGMGEYFIDCACDLPNQGMSADEVIFKLQIDRTTLRNITKDLMISDVWV